MKLWQEIIFLKKFHKCSFVVENTKSYYKPFIAPDFIVGKHYYWSDKMILDYSGKRDRAMSNKCTMKDLIKCKGLDLSKYKFEGIDKRQVLRNMVEPEDGKYIFEQITGARQ